MIARPAPTAPLRAFGIAAVVGPAVGGAIVGAATNDDVPFLAVAGISLGLGLIPTVLGLVALAWPFSALASTVRFGTGLALGIGAVALAACLLVVVHAEWPYVDVQRLAAVDAAVTVIVFDAIWLTSSRRPIVHA